MPKILVVDDEESIRALYTEELTSEGYDVIATGRCSEVLSLIASTQPSGVGRRERARVGVSAAPEQRGDLGDRIADLTGQELFFHVGREW